MTNHGPIREDGGGWYCGTCGLPANGKTDCQGPRPYLDQFTLNLALLALKELAPNHTGYASAASAFEDYLNWKGCSARLGYQKDHYYFDEALYEITDSLMKELGFTTQYVRGDDNTWSAEISFNKDNQPKDFNFNLYSREIPFFKDKTEISEKDAEQFLSKELTQKLGSSVSVIVIWAKTNKNERLFTAMPTNTIRGFGVFKKATHEVETGST